jgi:hypothetical protein
MLPRCRMLLVFQSSEVCGAVAWSYLKLLGLVCHPLLSSTLIFTHRNIISSPPLKSMPSCTMSPSLTIYGFDSVPGGLSLMWLRKVPEELFASLIYHLPPSNQNSQCLRLTTLLLKPTGAAEGTFAGATACCSLSEYRPTLIVSLPVGSVLDTGLKDKDCRFDRES